MSWFRVLLIPFSLIYGLLTSFRNALFRIGILPSKKYDLPIITVGNLSVGGTGKTPHTEYLLSLLDQYFKMAVLSRGYKRKSNGFILANQDSTPDHIGDEPKQIDIKFPNVKVAVDGNRVRGIKLLQEKVKNLNAIILDDAFQHRYVDAGLKILLTPYDKLYIDDFFLPTGSLRESKSGSKRADIIVVTKTSKLLSPLERRMVRTKLSPQPYQKVFFSYYHYNDFVPLFKKNKRKLETIFNNDYSALVVTGIAKANDLTYYLKQNLKNITHLKFIDHHEYMLSDAIKIKKSYEGMQAENRIIITTEKDAVKLMASRFQEILGELPIYYLPINVKFHQPDEVEFNEQIINYVRNNKIDSGIHKK